MTLEGSKATEGKKSIENYVESIYINRLHELAEDPDQDVCQLGLIRICYEGKFQLKYTFEKEKVTVIASK